MLLDEWRSADEVSPEGRDSLHDTEIFDIKVEHNLFHDLVLGEESSRRRVGGIWRRHV